MEDHGSPLIVAYVSGHGFGHAVRTSVVLAELVSQMPGTRAIVKTLAPQWLFSWLGAAVEVITAQVDQPPVQRDAFVMDALSTVTAMQGWLANKETWLRDEEAWLRRTRPTFILADISPLALVAADRARIPSVLVANFTWEWILTNAGIQDARIEDLARELASYTALATWCFQPWPAAEDMGHPRPIRVGLIGRRCTHDRRAIRHRLGIGDGERAALLSFGGVGASGIDFAAVTGRDDIVFMSTTPRPGLAGCRHVPIDIPHACLVHAADVVVGKLGYCTVAEALVHGTPYLFAPRLDWPEERVLQEAVEQNLPNARVPWPKFASGVWGDTLRELAASPKASGQPPYGGHQVASLLSQAFGKEPWHRSASRAAQPPSPLEEPLVPRYVP